MQRAFSEPASRDGMFVTMCSTCLRMLSTETASITDFSDMDAGLTRRFCASCFHAVYRWMFQMKVRFRFVCRRDSEQQRLVTVIRDDLHANRQPVRAKAAGNGNRRHTRETKRQVELPTASPHRRTLGLQRG